MSPTEIKARAFDELVSKIQTIQSDLESNPNLNYADYAATLNGLFESVAGMDYVVSETISGQERQHQAYQRVMEEA
jgi:hypothetical protein